MKLQTLLIMAGIATAVATASCQFFEEKKTTDEAEENSDYIGQVNAHIDRRLAEFNEKEEARLPIFIPREAKAEFQDLSFIKIASQLKTLSVVFEDSNHDLLNMVVDRDSRTFTRSIMGKDMSETYTFEPFTNGVTPDIPWNMHILYAFATNFNRIADRVELRSFKRLESGENPGIAEVETDAANEKNKNKKKKVVVEIENKTVYEPLEFQIEKRWCHCYDVKLKSFCAPAVALALFVNNEEKTIARIDVIKDDDTKETFLIDWREAKDRKEVVLPYVIQHLAEGVNNVYIRKDSYDEVMLKGDKVKNEELEEAIREQNAQQYATEYDDVSESDEYAEESESASDDEGEGDDEGEFEEDWEE